MYIISMYSFEAGLSFFLVVIFHLNGISRSVHLQDHTTGRQTLIDSPILGYFN